MNVTPVNFLQVAQGLKEGLVFRHPRFSEEEYLVLDYYGDIQVFDGRKVAPLELTPELVLSNQWENCNKQVLYILGTKLDFHLVSDEVFIDYLVSTEDKDHHDSWEDFILTEEEMLDKKRYVDIQIGSHAHLTEDEKRRVLQHFTGISKAPSETVLSNKTTPAFYCHVIVEEQHDGYHVVKSTLGYPSYGSVLQDVKVLLTMPLRVCVRTSHDKGKYVYNFDIEQYNPH